MKSILISVSNLHSSAQWRPSTMEDTEQNMLLDLVSDQHIVMDQYQTISLPPDLQLTPGTVLTLHNGQVLRIEQSSQVPPPPSPDRTPPQITDSKRKPGRPKKQEVKFEKPVGPGPFPCNICGEEFESWTSCRKHVKSHQQDKKFRLDVLLTGKFNVLRGKF